MVYRNTMDGRRGSQIGMPSCKDRVDFKIAKLPGDQNLPRKSLSADRPQMSFCLYPCPCGYWGDPTHNCTCSPAIVTRYQSCFARPPVHLLAQTGLHTTALESSRRARLGRCVSSALRWYERLQIAFLDNVPQAWNPNAAQPAMVDPVQNSLRIYATAFRHLCKGQIVLLWNFH
jgi:hypothetical protein